MTTNELRSVRIVYFAWVRERIGLTEESVVLPPDVTTVADLAGWLACRGSGYAEAFARPGVVRAALDRTHAGPGAQIGAAREIAFFPPVTGG